MGRTEGKNGSFMAIRMRIHQKLCSSLTSSWTLKKEIGGRRLCPNFWLLCAYMVYLLLFLYCGALVGCPGVSENKTLNSGSTSVVFFSCYKKFMCLGDVLDSVTPITLCHIEVPSFERFYWSSTAFFLLSENCGMWSNISFNMSAVAKKAQHNFIGQF